MPAAELEPSVFKKAKKVGCQAIFERGLRGLAGVWYTLLYLYHSHLYGFRCLLPLLLLLKFCGSGAYFLCCSPNVHLYSQHQQQQALCFIVWL